jgi:hypothetical protein
MSYTNVPAYQPMSGLRPRTGMKFAIAQRVPGQGAVVTAAFRTEREAANAKRRAEYHNEWVSPVLSRHGSGWAPVARQRRAMYATPELVAVGA